MLCPHQLAQYEPYGYIWVDAPVFGRGIVTLVPKAIGIAECP